MSVKSDSIISDDSFEQRRIIKELLDILVSMYLEGCSSNEYSVEANFYLQSIISDILNEKWMYILTLGSVDARTKL